MTRVSALAVLFFAAMTLAVTNVNAQCSSCNQATPVFAQAYSPAPAYAAMPSYATPQYTQTAFTPAPIQSDCVGCGQAQPVMAQPVMAQPVAQTYTAMPAQGCCGGCAPAPAPSCCAPAPAPSCCAPAPSCCPDPCCKKPSFRERRAAKKAQRQAAKCCNTCCG